jgi:hypothetical protein
VRGGGRANLVYRNHVGDRLFAITSSTVASSDGGTSMPSALAGLTDDLEHGVGNMRTIVSLKMMQQARKIHHQPEEWTAISRYRSIWDIALRKGSSEIRIRPL